MPVSWDFYVGRRIKNLEAWFRLNNITTYDEFLSHVNVNDVVPPPESEIKEYLEGKPTPKQEVKQEVKALPPSQKPQQNPNKEGEDWSWAETESNLIEISGD